MVQHQFRCNEMPEEHIALEVLALAGGVGVMPSSEFDLGLLLVDSADFDLVHCA